MSKAASRGELVAIFVTPAGGEAMQRVEAVRAVPGVGLFGDRYATGRGSWSKPGLWSEVTLIAEEAVEAAFAELGRRPDPAAIRRNLVTRGLDLEDAIGRVLRAGDVRLEGVRRCDPCARLERAVGLPGLRGALEGRGGLRARIVREGVLRPGPLELV